MLDTRAARAEGGDAFLVGGASAGGGVSVWWVGRHWRGARGASFFGDVGAGTRFYIGNSGTGVGFFSALRVRVAISLSAAGAGTGSGRGSFIFGDIFVNSLRWFLCWRWRCGTRYGSFIGGVGEGGGRGEGGLFGCGLFAGSGVGLKTVSVSL